MKLKHPEFDTNKDKVKARMALTNFYHYLTGKRAIDKNGQYWTLSSIQSKRKGSEIEQLTNSGFLKKSQFYGVDISEEKIKMNKRKHPEAHWFCGEWVNIIMSNLDIYNPSVVYLDSCSILKGGPIVDLVSATLEYTNSGVVFVNMMMNNPHSGEKFKIAEFMRAIVEELGEDTLSNWDLQPRQYTYCCSTRTDMTTIAFTRGL